ncbi:hypothetical protein Q5P01_021622 [Channa striata]|uniref:Secreted protein n=1 Tax=Channa striata TaxID=64152 RepID=A0AA88LUH9_CHASR|nr:hypothetical protein Q5P01_021622 [Channa striata]
MFQTSLHFTLALTALQLHSGSAASPPLTKEHLLLIFGRSGRVETCAATTGSKAINNPFIVLDHMLGMTP